ncbi:MAG TPA: phosphotransferase family protein [Acidimicrobiales bacterium]|nr:phosphotransferase family protein [Acidimicrobiales bacterium]
MTDTSADTSPRGIDAANVTRWFLDHAEDVEPPLSFDLIAGGRSNLTFRVDDAAGRAWVLRRPPLGQVLATAHDMGREHKIISALAPTDVPVAPTIGLCTDEDVNGAPFYVMGFVDGVIARGVDAGRLLTVEARERAGHDLPEVLARIHAVDPDAVGLGDLGRKEGYIERQLRRWYRQWESSKTRELPVVDEVHDALAARVPEQGPAAIVHGDYRLDNCILSPDGRIAAVLDWELCTLGDPLADVGLLLVYWTDRNDTTSALMETTTTLDGFPDRTELIRRYAAASGRDVGDVDFYVAFGFWKLACILEGVNARYQGGVMGESDSFQGFAGQVEMLARRAQAVLDGLAS